MLILENILLALSALKANKSRSFLTMLGIIIGITSVIAIMTLGNSVSSSVTDSMASMGATNITIGVRPKSSSDEELPDGTTFKSTTRNRSYGTDDLISDEMIEAMKEAFPDQVDKVLLTQSVGTGKAGDDTDYAYVTITGVNQDELTYEDLTLKAGRLLNEEDQDESRHTCLVSDRYVTYVFGGNMRNALGSTTEIQRSGKFYTYTIVGVYEYEDVEAGFSDNTSEQDTPTTLYIPLSTAKSETHSDDGYSQITVTIQGTGSSSDLVDEIEDWFNSHYYRRNDNFQISAYNMESMMETLTSMIGTIEAILAVIAGISLVVGGVGVMNIMLVSITERTKEIGTRKALGATNASIRLQFIMESVVICLVGGIIGIILGIAVGLIGAKAMDTTGSVSTFSIFLSFGFSAAIGIFFGYYPANKAAKMNPIDALRYE